jgi:hypothetical protein
VASDCLAVINNMEQHFAGSYCMVLKEIKTTARSFDLISFKHESRLSNTEAYLIARSVVATSVGRQVWLTQPPAGLCIPVNKRSSRTGIVGHFSTSELFLVS